MPKFLLEAALIGHPIVIPGVASCCREVEEFGDNGSLVTPQNFAALAVGLGELISDSFLRSEMGVSGRSNVEEESSVQAVVAATLETYNDMTRSMLEGSPNQADPLLGRR